MTRLTWQEYFEQFIRPRLQDLAASQASGRELIERLRAIAADYKRFLFDDNSPGAFFVAFGRAWVVCGGKSLHYTSCKVPIVPKDEIWISEKSN
jgi:hypothetical protein